MKAQDSAVQVTPIWSGWQNTVINGLYPLQRLVNGSAHSAIFLTECKALGVACAAVKIVPIEQVTLAQLSHWRSASGLSHPHLIRLFDAGLCQLGGRPFLFVVMEYAEQTLREVLDQRALTGDEVHELLPPTLDALSFVHRNGLVLAHLKPPNVLVVNDQLKLATDSIRPSGAPRVGIAEPSFYDPPEAGYARFASADDIWGLGVTLVEALTQTLPWANEQSDAACLPSSMPATYAQMVQRCLHYSPATRPSATDLQAPVASAPVAPPLPAPPPPAPIPQSSGQPGRMPAVVAIVFLIVLAAVWADLHLFRVHDAAPIVAARSAAVAPLATPNPPAQLPPPAAIHAQMPNVARSALRTIHGHIKIAVLVVVDRSGAVIDAHLKNTGPSSYFARLARDAARQWTFTPAAAPGSRQWLLRFEFTHSGVTGVATPSS
ncbi:MAG TPA: protein kinase [Steroidobacteraceae bacterium]